MPPAIVTAAAGTISALAESYNVNVPELGATSAPDR
jgi:hypothetical protein